MGQLLNPEILEGVHPDLVSVINAAVEAIPYDVKCTEGIRSFAVQQKYVNEGKSRTLKGRHLKADSDGYGHAADLCFAGATQAEVYDWDKYWVLADAMRTASIALNIPVRWGAVWDKLLSELAGDPQDELNAYAKRFKAAQRRAPLIDGPHFELPVSVYPD